MKNFRTYEQANLFYKECKELRFVGPAQDQFKRALLSICLNLAEGSAKPTGKDRRRFYYIALGSLREVQTILDLHEYKTQFKKADRLGAMIYRLCQNPGAGPGSRVPGCQFPDCPKE